MAQFAHLPVLNTDGVVGDDGQTLTQRMQSKNQVFNQVGSAKEKTRLVRPFLLIGSLWFVRKILIYFPRIKEETKGKKKREKCQEKGKRKEEKNV